VQGLSRQRKPFAGRLIAVADLFREFRIANEGNWKSFLAFMAGNNAAAITEGKPLRITVTQEETRRTAEQNRFWHGPVLDAITEQAWWNGRQYPKEFWREYFRRRYLLKDEYTTPAGEIVSVYWSTADLNITQMTEFLNKVQAEAATEWGVEMM
jgi:hypothetical protein